MIYLDANATTLTSEGVRQAVVTALCAPAANPSSIHAAGTQARAAMERARDDVCTLLIGALPEGIVFTSGGTEGNNAVLRGMRGTTVVTTNVEHPSVTQPAQASGKHIEVPVSRVGMVEPQAVAQMLPQTGLLIVSIQWANSETGVIQPIPDVVAAVRSVRPDAFIHVDAAQAIGRLPIEMHGIDALTCSGHKLHGPPGTGVLALGDPDDNRLQALLLGGGQERGRRSGTQNVPGAVGLGTAFRERSETLAEASHAMRMMRDAFEKAVLDGISGSRANGADAPRVPNTSNLFFPGIDAMAFVAHLDQRGVACSVGSACSSGRPEPSHVLLAMGLNEQEAYSCVRFTFSVMSTPDEAMRAAEIVTGTARRMR